MNRYTIRMFSRPSQSGNETALELHSPSLQLAMIVADINMDKGAAEIWQGSRCIARVEKQPSSGAPYWKVS